MAARRSSEIVAAIVHGKMHPREMPPIPLPDSNPTGGLAYPKTAPLLSSKTVAAVATSSVGPSSSKADVAVLLPAVSAPAPTQVTATLLQNTATAPLQARTVVPLVPRKPSAGGSRGGSAMAAMMGGGSMHQLQGASFQAMASTGPNQQGGDASASVKETCHATLAGVQGLASSSSPAKPAGESVRPLSSRPISAIGSLLGGSAGARKSGGGGSMAGILGGRREAVNSSMSQVARQAAESSSADRVERLKASFTLPFVCAPNALPSVAAAAADPGSAAKAARAMPERNSGATGSNNEEERAGGEAGTRSDGQSRGSICL